MLFITFFYFVALVACRPGNNTVSNDTPPSPRIVSREEWKARKPRGREAMPYTPAPYVVVHHGGIPSYCHDQTSCAAIVRSYQNFHMDDRHWQDIGYSFVIGEDGNVYEGRGWSSVGAHAPKYNNQSIGVCVIGDFTKLMPNDAALKALNWLIERGVALGKIREDYRLIGHRQVRNTECPGETFYKYVKRLPHWADNPVPVTDPIAPMLSTTLSSSTTTKTKTTATSKS